MAGETKLSHADQQTAENKKLEVEMVPDRRFLVVRGYHSLQRETYRLLGGLLMLKEEFFEQEFLRGY